MSVVREIKKGVFRNWPIVVVAVSTTLMFVNAKLAFESSRLRERIQFRSKPSGGELEALRLIPVMESELTELEQRRKLSPAAAPHSE